MFIVVKHVLPAVWSKLRPALRLATVAGLLSVLLVAGGAQFFGFNLASFAAVGPRSWQKLLGPDTAARRIAPAQTHSGLQPVASRAQKDTAQLKLVSASAAPGSRVTVPVELNAAGQENTLAFSFSYDGTALSQPQVALTQVSLLTPGARWMQVALTPVPPLTPGARSMQVALTLTRAKGMMLPRITHKTVSFEYAAPKQLFVYPPRPLPEWLIAWQGRWPDLAA